MKKSRFNFGACSRLILVWLLISGPAGSAAASGRQSESDELLNRARQSYYNLREAGLVDFQAIIKPNWSVVIAGARSSAEARKVLNGLHFSISIDAASKLRLDHHVGVAPGDQKLAEAVEQMFRQMDDAVSSFFSTWSIFMLTSPFPQIGSEWRVKQTGGQYEFSHKEPTSEVVTTTDRNFMIIEMKVTGADFDGSLKPVFEKTRQGFVLKGYAANYHSLSGARTTSVKAMLQYEEQHGLQMLRKVELDTIYKGQPAQLEWLFTDYQIQVRDRI